MAHIVKAMAFPTVMHSCTSWTIKRDEHQTSDTFELWCWRRVLRIPWTARRSNQSILKEISPEYSLEGMTLKLKLQYFAHLMWRTDSLEKTLMLGKIEGTRRREWQMMRWLMASSTQWTRVWANAGRIVKDREAWQAAVHGVTKSQTQLSDCTTTAPKLWWLVRGQQKAVMNVYFPLLPVRTTPQCTPLSPLIERWGMGFEIPN